MHCEFSQGDDLERAKQYAIQSKAGELAIRNSPALEKVNLTSRARK
jgi:hypothetical protein